MAAREGVGEPVDVGARSAFGERNEETVLVFGVFPTQPIPRRDPLLAHSVEHRLHRRIDTNRELADDGRLVQELDPVQPRQPLPGVGGSLGEQLAQLDHPALAEPGEVDHPAERVQGLRGADVVGGLLAADVLLAGLEGQHEAAPPVGVHRLPRDPARHPAQVLLRGAEEPERGTTEVEPAAERLALADRDVDPTLPRRPQHPQGERVDRGDRQRARALRGRGEGLEILHRAEKVRVLDEQGGGVAVQRRLELGGVGEAALEAHLHHLGAEASGVGGQRLAAVGVKAPRDDQAAAPGGAHRQVRGRGHR